MDAGGERAAVRGARLVKVQVGLKRASRHLVGHEVVQHQHVGLLEHLGGADPLVAQQHVGGDRSLRRKLGDQERLERVEAGELLVHAGLRVIAIDDRVGQLEPVSAFRSVDPPGTHRCGVDGGSSAP